MLQEFQKMGLDHNSFNSTYEPAFNKIYEHFDNQNANEKNKNAVEVEARREKKLMRNKNEKQN